MRIELLNLQVVSVWLDRASDCRLSVSFAGGVACPTQGYIPTFMKP